jgi:hypothetical protein
MNDRRIIGIFILVTIFGSIGGCIGPIFSNTSQVTFDTTLPPVSITPQDCIIDDNQSGAIEILEIRYAKDIRGEDRRRIYPIDDERMFGTAKNVGTNTISGTIEYKSILVDVVDHEPRIVKYLRQYSFKFCNIKPGQEFRFNFPDFNLKKGEKQGGLWFRWTINAGQNITTTGMGARQPLFLEQ